MNMTDSADVAIKPPVLFLGALAIGCLLSLILPVGPRLGSANGLALSVGLTFVAIGFALAALSVRRFRLAGTSVVPGQPSTALVVEGQRLVGIFTAHDACTELARLLGAVSVFA
jgi:hypothetical protein